MNTVAKGGSSSGIVRLSEPEVERVPNARDTILRVAAVLFSSKGFAESGLREIAEMAGIRSSTVYHYFGSKDRIYEEIIRIAIELTIDSVSKELDALPAQATPRMRVDAAIRGHLRALHANKPFTSTNAQSRIKLPKDVHDVIHPFLDRYSDFWQKLLDEARASGWLKENLDTRILRPLILGTLNRTIGWFDEREGPCEVLIDTTIVAFSGIWNETPLLRTEPKLKTRSARLPSARSRQNDG